MQSGWGCLLESCVRLHGTSKRCMAPLMQLDGDEVLEASPLGHANHRYIMPLTMEEEAVLLVDELEPQQAPEVTTSPPE